MAPIAVDVMGGDHAPGAVVDGVLLAAQKIPGLDLCLVGHRDEIVAELEQRGERADRFPIVHASERVEMHESPVEALRRKPDSSIRKMMGLVREKRAETAFSAGNTGAMVAAATVGLGLLPGVRRAGILVTFPLGPRPKVLVDAGANMQCKAQHLFQYAVMGAEFASRVYGVENPSVGLLNVGEEEQKGNLLVKETSELLQGSSLRYLGNIEGDDVFMGDCDVIVCDGFVGNIVLKVSEGLSEKMLRILHEKVAAICTPGAGSEGAHATAENPGARAIQAALRSLAESVDYAEYGGAPLLGVEGNVLIGHGRSDGRAIASALRLADQMQRVHLREHLIQAVAAAG